MEQVNKCWVCQEEINKDEYLCGWCKLMGYKVNPSPDPNKPELGSIEMPINLDDIG